LFVLERALQRSSSVIVDEYPTLNVSPKEKLDPKLIFSLGESETFEIVAELTFKEDLENLEFKLSERFFGE
jgi:hypothetical protein